MVQRLPPYRMCISYDKTLFVCGQRRQKLSYAKITALRPLSQADSSKIISAPSAPRFGCPDEETRGHGLFVRFLAQKLSLFYLISRKHISTAAATGASRLPAFCDTVKRVVCRGWDGMGHPCNAFRPLPRGSDCCSRVWRCRITIAKATLLLGEWFGIVGARSVRIYVPNVVADANSALSGEHLPFDRI